MECVRRCAQIDESLYLDLPGTEPAIKYYDLKGAGGTMGGAKNGQRVAVHFDVKVSCLRRTPGSKRLSICVCVCVLRAPRTEVPARSACV